MTKRYILQKDLPEVKAGAVYNLDEIGGVYLHNLDQKEESYFQRKYVENNPEWFLPEDEFGKWVPVSERLPNEDGRYLVICADRSNYIETYFFTKSGKWWSHLGYGATPPIAWMPLPKPYQP